MLGKRLIDGEQVADKIQQLRALLPSSTDALRFVDELEQLVNQSKIGFLGKHLISEEDFFVKVQQLRWALRTPDG